MAQDLIGNFPKDRESGLRKIWRYSMVDTMFYRTNNWIHSNRVFWIVSELGPAAKRVYPRLNVEKTKAMALVHDDPELVMGDVQAGHKIWMNKARMQALHQQELAAIAQIAKRWPSRVGGFSYVRLMQEAMEKRSLESQLVSYADKLDAYCESLHELMAGNTLFIEPVALYVAFLHGSQPSCHDLRKCRKLARFSQIHLPERTKNV